MKIANSVVILGVALAAVTRCLAAAGPVPDGGPVGTIVVKDSLDRAVVVPRGARRIISIQPEISRMLVALGAGATLVGADYNLRLRDPLFKLVFPEESRIPLVSMSENNVNQELVLSLKPDVIFVSPFERQIVASLETKTRTPVVALASMGDFTKLAEEMTLLGRVLGREARAAELVAYFNGTVARVRRTLGDLPANTKPRVYLAFWGSLTRTPLLYAPVTAAGGVNVAEKAVPDFLGSVQTMVNVEQLLRWDPDIILVHGNYRPEERAVTPESVLKDPRLSATKAVRARHVYYTFGFWDWWDMAEVTLETMYLAHLFHPEKFPAYEMMKDGDAVIKMFYGVENVFAAFCRVLKCEDWAHD